MSDIGAVEWAAYKVPTDGPEADGTFAWDATTIVVVQVHAGAETGLGWTYAPAAAGHLIGEMLAPAIGGRSATGHCAPALHVDAAAATPNLRHLEYFHDHVRIEARFFDGVTPLGPGGTLTRSCTRPATA